MTSPFTGWERYGLTWCRTSGGVRMEVSRAMNNETGLIEWHALAWTEERRDPLVSRSFCSVVDRESVRERDI